MGSNRLHQNDYKQLCKLLRQWREDAGLSQRALATRLEQTQAYVYKCEAGERRMDPIEWLAWLDAVDVSHADGCEAISALP